MVMQKKADNCNVVAEKGDNVKVHYKVRRPATRRQVTSAVELEHHADGATAAVPRRRAQPSLLPMPQLGAPLLVVSLPNFCDCL